MSIAKTSKQCQLPMESENPMMPKKGSMLSTADKVVLKKRMDVWEAIWKTSKMSALAK